MKQTDFGDVPDELWERTEPLLAPFKRKRSGGSEPLSQRTILAEILFKCRNGCQWVMLPACYGSKSSVHEHFQRWNKAVPWRKFFAYSLRYMGKKSAWMPNGNLWAAPCCKLRCALKKQRLRVSDATRRTEKSGGKIHLHVDGQGIPLWSDGHWRQCA